MKLSIFSIALFITHLLIYPFLVSMFLRLLSVYESILSMALYLCLFCKERKLVRVSVCVRERKI
jgi:hypothetical protein